MGVSEKIRKAINFDLSTLELKKHFKDTREPYGNIKKFMLDNGFEHKQYSGYTSKEALNRYDITKLAKQLNATFPWLGDCIQEFDVTNIGSQYSLKSIFTTTKPKPQESISSIDDNIEETKKGSNEFDDLFKSKKDLKDNKEKEIPKPNKIRRQK